MIKQLSNLFLLLSIVAFVSSCNSANDEVDPNLPTQGAVEHYYNITTAGLNATKQFVTVFNVENAEKIEDLKLFEIGKNEFINIYLKDGSRIDITNQQEGGNLFDIMLSQPVALSDIDYKKHTYRNTDGEIKLLKTSIKVVHEIIEEEPSIIAYENLTTIGVGASKQNVNVYDANESTNDSDFDQYVIGENRFVNIYVKDGEDVNRVDVTNVEPNTTLKQLLEEQGIDYDQLSNNRHNYKDEEGSLVSVATSIKVVK
ncbi:hypothetical protein KMW28_00920 [Flammeovirga yaeyamensis]|uniref:Lipoprotein n=1 Tax=Flammeovirga yaeyamensis TaxID=367791 RepID=A0AAX1N3V2_9BACT|nr:hypothetical protein [Flammeovirga yaeyamensis]MBB3699645.1 hypothetical protein [Flammeovirga yaeyamensis]NMF36784.1 hypothetical protein [Flammeovirga yaeyamensis]QWG02176.1 hypothetical protein KMW28_00920 [Flammeovirga yaeyamensis]